MINLTPDERSLLLSQYLDGMLTDEERRAAEALLARDEDACRELEELKRLAALLGGHPRLEPDIGFWTRLSVRIEDQRKEEQNLLPFPRRYVPHVATAVTMVVAVCGFLTISNRMPIMAFFSKQSLAVKNVYEQSVLKGSILPLFASVDKDRALQFSLFGELSLDEKSQTALRVDESVERGYRIEVGKPSKRKAKPVTFDSFVEEVKPTIVQRRVIDSLLNFAQERIASAVLVGENNAFAIDPELPQLNRIMVTGIASCLEPPQRQKLERLLAVHEAPYAVSMKHGGPAIPAREVFSRLRPEPRVNRFMVITPDTAMFTEVQINLDSLRRRMEIDMSRFEEQRRALFQRMEAGEFRWVTRSDAAPHQSFQSRDSGFFQVEFGPELDELPPELRVMVAPRPRKPGMPPVVLENGGGLQIRIYHGTGHPRNGGKAGAAVNVQVDTSKVEDRE